MKFICDTPNMENKDCENMVLQYCEFSGGIFLVFDLTEPSSLKKVENWIDSNNNLCSKKNIIILGNKTDLKRRLGKDIIKKELQQYENNKIIYMETSAKKNKNIQYAIEAMIDLIEGREPFEDECCHCFKCF